MTHRFETSGSDRRLEFTTTSQLQELEKTLSRVMFQSRDIHNMFSSKDRVLPDDVLYLVLEQACVVQAQPAPSPWEHSSIFYGSSRFSQSTARVLSCVCRRWRSLLLSNPVVWSDARITIKRPENLFWLDTCLARSAAASAGCMVRIDQPLGINQGVNIAEAISRHPSNIRCLEISPRAREDYAFLASKMDNLERLHIKAGTYSRTPLPTPSHLTKLRVLILQRLPAVPHDSFSNITDLTLSTIVSPMANLVDVLQTNEALEILRINRTAVSADPLRRLVSLPNLKLLCISHSSPVTILHMLSPLPIPSRVIIHDDVTNSVTSDVSALFNPFLIFGPNDPVRTASISVLPGEAPITFHTLGGATVEITVQVSSLPEDEHIGEFFLLLGDVARWGPFPNLCSLNLHIETSATEHLHTIMIKALISVAPRLTHLSISGRTLFHHVCQALHSGLVCPELEYFRGVLHPNDPIDNSLRSLSETLKRRATAIRTIVLDIPLREEEIRGILSETGLSIEEMKSHGVDQFSLNSTTK